MLSANFKPKRTAATSRGFLATARLSCCILLWQVLVAAWILMKVTIFCYCRLAYPQIFGGVTAFRQSHFERTNGFSNCYYGWGGEDDDMSNRWVFFPEVAVVILIADDLGFIASGVSVAFCQFVVTRHYTHQLNYRPKNRVGTEMCGLSRAFLPRCAVLLRCVYLSLSQFKAVITIAIRLYDTTTKRRWNYDSTAIRPRQDYDKTTTKKLTC